MSTLTTHNTNRLLETRNYRPDIDGMRAIAVMLVLLFHAGISFPGGFIGVDLFFVISGYLISGSIAKEIEEEQFSFTAFWIRRIRRLIPAATLMVCVVLLAGFWILLPTDLHDLGYAAISQQLMFANIYAWQDSGYFDGPADLKPLLHTWSLAVEEQFYFVFPFLLILLNRIRSMTRMAIILMLTLASLTISIYGVQHHPTATFFLLPSRAWEMLIGAAVCFIPKLNGARSTLRETASWSSIAAIFSAALLLNEHSSFPGLNAFIPCCATGIFIYFNTSKLSSAGRLLSHKTFVFLGLISYSLYLWHWPIIVFTRYMIGANFSVLTGATCIAITVPIAYLSWRYIERPFRENREKWNVHRLMWCYLVSFLFLACCSLSLIFGSGIPQRFSVKDQQMLATSYQNKHFKAPDIDKIRSGQIDLLGDQSKEPLFVLFGDSHASMLLETLDQMGKDEGFSFYSLAKGGRGGRVLGDVADEQIRFDAMMDFLASSQCNNILIAARWTWYFGSNKRSSVSPAEQTANLSQMQDFLLRLSKAGVSTTLMGEVPCQAYGDAYGNVLRMHMLHPNLCKVNSVDLSEHKRFTLMSNAVLQKLRVPILDPTTFCFSEDQHSYTIVDGQPTYWDDDHLNDFGVRVLLGDMLRNWILQLDKSI